MAYIIKIQVRIFSLFFRSITIRKHVWSVWLWLVLSDKMYCLFFKTARVKGSWDFHMQHSLEIKSSMVWMVCYELKSISKCPTRWNLRQLGYMSRRRHRDTGLGVRDWKKDEVMFFMNEWKSIQVSLITWSAGLYVQELTYTLSFGKTPDFINPSSCTRVSNKTCAELEMKSLPQVTAAKSANKSKFQMNLINIPQISAEKQ